MVRIFKILRRSEWVKALREGVFVGSEVDLRDGYIHFSTADQVVETARKYFSGQSDLVLVSFEAGSLTPEVRWEKSRNDQLFPHLYGPLDPALALVVDDLPWDGHAHRFPESFNT
jgi:uncharacterized protein (DUF952 family)